MDRDNMQRVASLMLVSLAADGYDIRPFAKRLVASFAYGNDEQFRNACREVGTLYRGG